MLTEKYGDKLSLTVEVPGLANATDEDTVRKTIRDFVDKYAPRGHRVVASGLMALPNKDLMPAALEELYYYSSEYYAKVRAAEGK